MKKYLNILTALSVVTVLTCAFVLSANPAYAAATINQLSIRELNATLLGEDDVPPPRMFTESSDFLTPAGETAPGSGWFRYQYVDSSGQTITVFYNLANGTFHSSVGGPQTTVPFPTSGRDYTFDGTDPHPGLELRGRGPHGGYTTTSAKCAVCHSAHSATAVNDDAREGQDASSSSPGANMLNVQGQSFLTRSGSTSCQFCHLTGTTIGAAGMSSNIVFTGGEDGVSDIGMNTAGEDFSGHRLAGVDQVIPNSLNLNGGGQVTIPGGLSCSTCHAVHGNVSTWQPPDFFRGGVSDPLSGASFADAGQHENNETVTEYSYKMLRNNPVGSANPRVGAVPNALEDAGTAYAVDTNQLNQFTMNVWCANCHNAPSMSKTMSSIRPMSETESEQDAFLESIVTTFTATANMEAVHDENGGFATEYGSAPVVPAQPHSTAFVGVYSGPGQCYTCHRGDLGAALTAQWVPHVSGEKEVIVPVPDEDNPPLFGAGSPERFRALGYFSLDAQTNPERLEQQARTLACGSCHFGTADYAFWAPRSDWPHRSGSGDTSLLGVDRAISGAEAGLNAQNFCGRCHVPVDLGGTPNGFVISHHYVAHSVPDNSGNVGDTGNNQSPGPVPAPAPPPPSNEATPSQ